MEDTSNTTASEPTAIAPQPPVRNPSKRNRWLGGLTLLLILLGVSWLVLWMIYFRDYEETDDAYVNGNLIHVSSVISGSVVAFFADDTDYVEEGQLLALLDETAYQVQYEKALCDLSQIALQVKQIYDNVEASRLNVQAKQVALARAQFDFKIRKNLIRASAVSQEDYVHAKDTLASAKVDLRQAKKQLQIAIAAAGPTSMENHPSIESQKNVVRSAFYQLNHCKVVAPASGYVAKRAVNVGQWVVPAGPLMAVIPSDSMWVDANFKETQLRDMRIGQSATVVFDLYGSAVQFEGKVLGISSGTGSVFSLIPPQNATGNWIKIVQRLPVRIGLQPNQMKEFPLRLGLSATVSVHIIDLDLPILAQVPSKGVIAKTSVFDYDFSEIETLMNRIVQDHLQTATEDFEQ